MKISKYIKYIVIVMIIFIVLFIYIINSNAYSKEGFNPKALLTYNSNSPKNSHNVDVINNPYSCSNFCGPKATCLKTGEQCTSDVDCYGCQPPIKSNGNKSISVYSSDSEEVLMFFCIILDIFSYFCIGVFTKSLIFGTVNVDLKKFIK